MKPGAVYLGFSSDFLIEESGEWHSECWRMTSGCSDRNFLFITKRIERFMDRVLANWCGGCEIVTVCRAIEYQRNADQKLSVFSAIPIRHKRITTQPLIERFNLEKHLNGIDLVVVDGESGKNARPLDCEWVLDIRDQCVRKVVDFEFRQCGTHFIKDGVGYTLQTRELCKQARSRRNQLQTLKFRRFAQFPSLCTIRKAKLLIMPTAFKVLVIIDKGDL